VSKSWRAAGWSFSRKAQRNPLLACVPAAAPRLLYIELCALVRPRAAPAAGSEAAWEVSCGYAVVDLGDAAAKAPAAAAKLQLPLKSGAPWDSDAGGAAAAPAAAAKAGGLLGRGDVP
jgi:hypothetical protein